MLKYVSIINQLSDRDKICILSDVRSLSYKEYKVLGIPEIKVGFSDRFYEDGYISASSLANSWDSKLFFDVSAEMAQAMKAQEVNLAVVPGARIKIAPVEGAISEDPVLSTAFSKECIRALSDRGIASCVSGFSVSPRDVEWLDDEDNSRLIYEYIVKPYRDLAKASKYEAIATEPDQTSRKCKRFNSNLTQTVANNGVSEDIAAICCDVSSENTVSYVANGGLPLMCSSIALEAALNHYKQLEKAVEHGSATIEELNAEVSKGKAISSAMLDLAIDRLIDFSYAIQSKRASISLAENGAEASSLALRALRSSAVLLKNDGILPMKKQAKVAVIGDLAAKGDFLQRLTAALGEKEFQFVGAERGYDIGDVRSDRLLEAALTLAETADVILLFLGFGSKQKEENAKINHMAIPANQQELLDRLAPHKQKTVAVLSGDLCPDIKYDENCAGILFAPMQSEYSPQVLAEMISGEINPCGKLANTVYIGSTEQFDDRQWCQKRDKLKTGPFVGYRYYDRAGISPGYPFGHGIGYTQFQYSDLRVDGKTAKFTVKNVGKVEGTEIAQVYVGTASSAVIRPLKELKGFARIGLKPGEEKTVSVPFEWPQVYNSEKGTWMEELCTYTVFVGASVSDIRLSASVEAGRDRVPPDGQNISDYISSESNIITGDFKLEAKSKPMKKSVLNMIAGIFALLLAIALKLYCAFTDVESLFFDVFSITLGVLGILFFILEAVFREKALKEKREEQKQKNEELFRDAEAMSVDNADSLFVAEFDVSSEEELRVEQLRVETDDESEKHIDREQTFLGAINDYEQLALEKGIKLAAGTAKTIFSALASSRIVILRDFGEKKLNSLMLLLGAYFKSGVYVDKVNADYTDDGSVLFSRNSQGDYRKTNVFSALLDAGKATENIHFATLTEVKGAELENYFTAYAKYAANPEGHHLVSASVSFADSVGKNTYTIPKNLWFVLNLADKESLANIPASVYESAAVIDVDFEEVSPLDKQTHFRKFTYYQMEYLAGRAVNEGIIDENNWKKIDKLEAYLATNTEYHIGNRMWLLLEKFAFVYLTCGGEETDAFEQAMAAKILPSMIRAIAGHAEKNKKSFGEAFDEIFGDDSNDVCRKLIRSSGADLS